MLLHLDAPDVQALAVGEATLLLLQASDLSADGSTVIVRGIFTDNGDAGGVQHSGAWVYDLKTQAYTTNLNAVIAGRPEDAKNFEVTDVQVASEAESFTLLVKSRARGEIDADSKLALVVDGQVVDGNVLASVLGEAATPRIEHFEFSSDGRFLVLQTDSALFAPETDPDTNDSSDIYLIDLATDAVTRVSFVGGAEVTDPVALGSLLVRDGEVQVGFTSTAAFVAQDRNEDAATEAGQTDAYLWRSGFDGNGLTGSSSIELVSKTITGTASGLVEQGSAIATEAGVYFQSSADSLVANDPNPKDDVFLWAGSEGVSRIALANKLDIDADIALAGANERGTTVFVLTDAPEVVGVTGVQQLLAVDASDMSWRVVSTNGQTNASELVMLGQVSDNGASIAFTSRASNLSDKDVVAWEGDLFIDRNAPLQASAITLPAVNEDTSILITLEQLLVNANDPDGDAIFVRDFKASSGTVVDNDGLSWRFTPDADDDTSVIFSYVVTDGFNEIPLSVTMDLLPVNDAPTGGVTISGTAAQGQTLTVNSTVADGDGMGSLQYQWFANGASIANANGATYVLTQADVGKSVSVAVSYVDGYGKSESKTSSTTAAVLNVNDVPTGAVVISGTPKQGQSLRASNTLADADGMGAVSYQWLANGSAIRGASSSSYKLTSAEVGKVISVLASYVDGGGTSERVESSGTQAVQVDVKTVAVTARSQAIESIGLTPDGKSLVIKIDGVSQTVSRDSTLDFSDKTLAVSDLIRDIAPTPVFASVVNGKTEYVLPEKFTGPASLNLDYQLIDDTPNAVVTGSAKNDFIKLANTDSVGKAVDAGDGDDVIDGGVGSTFVTGGAGSNTFFLDGRAEGVSWSTITDFKLGGGGGDKATIWGWKQGVSKVARIDADGGAPGYEGVTFHFENLLPSDAVDGQTNGSWNSLTFSGKTLADFGAGSADELNAQVLAGSNPTFMTGVSEDQYGSHGYLYIA